MKVPLRPLILKYEAQTIYPLEVKICYLTVLNT